MGSRWRKLLGDARAERGRLLLMVSAITVSLAAVGTVLGAGGLLTREIAINYLGTHPAEATLELDQGVDAALLARVRRAPGVRQADAREVVLARVEVGDEHRPLLLFVPVDFTSLTLNTFTSQSGAWPPPTGTVLLERSALAMAGAATGGTLRIKTPSGPGTSVSISGVVHDPGLAPAWQEREVYAYASLATLELLGEPGVLHELRVTFTPTPQDLAEAEREGEALAATLEASGVKVHQVRVPPPRQHPHQRQMTTILVLLLTFAGLSLVLSSVLVATSLSAMLARQVREIGVLKTLGARPTQLAGLYGTLILALGAVAVTISLPLAGLGAEAFARAVSAMLNFDLTSTAIPGWVVAVQLGTGVLVPLGFAAIPISRAIRISVREALDSHGAPAAPRHMSTRWPIAVRNLLRRPARLALTVGLLAVAGALFMTALAVSSSWERNLDALHQTRHYDVEVRFNSPEGPALASALAALDGVKTVEAWAAAPGAFAREGRVDVVRTYPDRGHGSMWVYGVPPRTSLISFPLLAGRWLEEGDVHGVVLNHVARAQRGGARVGEEVLLSIDGAPSRWIVVGVVEEIGSPAIAYVTGRAFEQVTGTAGRRMVRVASSAATPQARTALIARIEALLAERGASVEWVIPFSELRTAIGDHLLILIQALMALAAILAIVGLLGLTSAVGVSVLERAREIGVLKALGATPAKIRSLFLTESLVIALASWLVAVLGSLPLTLGIDLVVGKLGFLAPLPFVVSAPAMLGWLVAVLAASVLATVPPMRRATSMSVREALAET